VGGKPADDLRGRRHLRGVVRRSHFGMQRRRERPRLRSIDGDLNEAHCLVVLEDATLRSADSGAGFDVEPATHFS